MNGLSGHVRLTSRSATDCACPAGGDEHEATVPKSSVSGRVGRLGEDAVRLNKVALVFA
jgi:hypothetical protein